MSMLSSPSRRLFHWLPTVVRIRNVSTNNCPVTGRRKKFTEKKVLGYTSEQIYSVVADIDHYKDFLPWCKESRVIKKEPGQCWAKLTVGFPPLGDSYTSHVQLKPFTSLRSVATDGRMFSFLETTWIFQPGPQFSSGPSTITYISTIFEFRSLIYATLGSAVFDEVARTLAASFESRCHNLYGPDHLKGTKRTKYNKTIHQHSSSQ